MSQDMTEPWPWNTWQKFSAALAPSYPDARTDPSYRSAVRRQLMTERFGDRWQQMRPNPVKQAAEGLLEADADARARGGQPADGSGGGAPGGARGAGDVPGAEVPGADSAARGASAADRAGSPSPERKGLGKDLVIR